MCFPCPTTTFLWHIPPKAPSDSPFGKPVAATENEDVIKFPRLKICMISDAFVGTGFERLLGLPLDDPAVTKIFIPKICNSNIVVGIIKT